MAPLPARDGAAPARRRSSTCPRRPAFQPLPVQRGVRRGEVARAARSPRPSSAEVKEFGVTVTAVCPGPVPTEFQETNDAQFAERLPKMTWVSPERVARRRTGGGRTGQADGDPGRPTREGLVRAEPVRAELAHAADRQADHAQVGRRLRPGCPQRLGRSPQRLGRSPQRLGRSPQRLGCRQQWLGRREPVAVVGEHPRAQAMYRVAVAGRFGRDDTSPGAPGPDTVPVQRRSMPRPSSRARAGTRVRRQRADGSALPARGAGT